MTRHRRYRAAFVLGVVCPLIVGAGGLWMRSYRRQEALNRLLIAALVNRDTNNALQLVKEGTDPNLPASDGATPLQMALKDNHPGLVALLKRAGAKK